jgi:hypothetical protein
MSKCPDCGGVQRTRPSKDGKKDCDNEDCEGYTVSYRGNIEWRNLNWG